MATKSISSLLATLLIVIYKQKMSSNFVQENSSNITVNDLNRNWFTEYGCQRYSRLNPFYKSTYMEHGWYPPNQYTAPLSYHPSRRAFTEHLSASGMYRNTSLNTVMDPKPIYN